MIVDRQGKHHDEKGRYINKIKKVSNLSSDKWKLNTNTEHGKRAYGLVNPFLDMGNRKDLYELKGPEDSYAMAQVVEYPNKLEIRRFATNKPNTGVGTNMLRQLLLMARNNEKNISWESNNDFSNKYYSYLFGNNYYTNIGNTRQYNLDSLQIDEAIELIKKRGY